jgi:activator of HSP90 ATPase
MGSPGLTPTIQQSEHFDASARELYAIYLDPKRHAAFTGHPVKIGAKTGSAFRAFGGMISGRMLATIPGKLIVQRWRSVHFNRSDPDSILVLQFVQDGRRGRIDLAHINVPGQDHAQVIEGWPKHYWKPLRRYLKSRK